MSEQSDYCHFVVFLSNQNFVFTTKAHDVFSQRTLLLKALFKKRSSGKLLSTIIFDRCWFCTYLSLNFRILIEETSNNIQHKGKCRGLQNGLRSNNAATDFVKDFALDVARNRWFHRQEMANEALTCPIFLFLKCFNWPFTAVVLNLVEHASPEGVNKFPVGASPYVLYNMESLTNIQACPWECHSFLWETSHGTAHVCISHETQK